MFVNVTAEEMETIYANERCYGSMNGHCICQNDGSYSFSLRFTVQWNDKEKIEEMKADAERQLKNDAWDKYYSPHRHPYMHSHRIGSLVAQEKLLDVCNPCKILHKAEITQKAARRNNARQTKKMLVNWSQPFIAKTARKP